MLVECGERRSVGDPVQCLPQRRKLGRLDEDRLASALSIEEGDRERDPTANVLKFPHAPEDLGESRRVVRAQENGRVTVNLDRDAIHLARIGHKGIQRVDSAGVATNLDMLAWFSEDERNVCGACGEQACVALSAAVASFCLACGAITIDGQRIDVDGRIPT
jgi:hypothetical protein